VTTSLGEITTSDPLPVVTIVTELVEGGCLERTAESVAAQSFRNWRWSIVAQADEQITVPDDPRIRIVRRLARASALREAVTDASRFIAVVDAGQVLGATALEKWAWFLETHPEWDGATARPEDRQDDHLAPLMIRGAQIASGASLDTAVSQAKKVAVVPVPGIDGHSEVDAVDYRAEGIQEPNAWLPEGAPFSNPVPKRGHRLLVVGAWMSVGGTDKVLLDLLDRLADHGWEAVVATTVPRKHDWLPQYAARTSELFPLEQFLPLLHHPRFLVYLIESRKPDVVMISNSELGYRLLPYLRARCPQTTFVDLCQSEAEHWNNGGYPRFSLEYSEFLDLTITVSQHLRHWMIERGGDPSGIEVSYANVDSQSIKPDRQIRDSARHRLGIASTDRVVMFAGRVTEDKQPRVVAAALGRLAKRGASFKAIIVGGGPDLDWLNRAITRHGLNERTHFTGEIPHEDLLGLLQAADVFFLPSRSEGIALALYEAMASGIPVVAASVGGQAELVSDDCGILIERTNLHAESEAYAAALAGLLADAPRRHAMGEASRRRIEEQFDLAAMGVRMNHLLKFATSRHRDRNQPIPTLGARASATEAIELTRLARVYDSMWNWRGDSDESVRGVSRRAYFLLARSAGPLYRYGLTRGWPFLPRMKLTLSRILIGG
jgi:glycosyltransferase involved in cell wall biosynthesis